MDYELLEIEMCFKRNYLKSCDEYKDKKYCSKLNIHKKEKQ